MFGLVFSQNYISIIICSIIQTQVKFDLPNLICLAFSSFFSCILWRSLIEENTSDILISSDLDSSSMLPGSERAPAEPACCSMNLKNKCVTSMVARLKAFTAKLNHTLKHFLDGCAISSKCHSHLQTLGRNVLQKNVQSTNGEYTLSYRGRYK